MNQDFRDSRKVVNKILGYIKQIADNFSGTTNDVIITDDAGGRVSIDEHIGAITTITGPHKMIHEGKFFDLSGIQTAVANGAIVDILFSFPAFTVGHLTNVEFQLDDGPCKVDFYENVVTSADGATALISNHNRLSAVTAGAVISIGPTITDIGDLLHTRHIPAGPSQGGQASGMLVPGEDNEWIIGDIIGSPVKYLWRITNNSGGAITIGYHFNGYEPGAS